MNNLRFRAPQPPTPWTAPYDATQPNTQCPQLKIDGTIFVGQEDCLYLSVYVPQGVAGPLPVMQWFFGGAYILGDGDEFGWYDGTALAEKTGAIIVAANYR